MLVTQTTLAGGKLVSLKTDVLALIQKVRELLGQQTGGPVTVDQAVVEIFRHQRGTASTNVVGLALAALGVPVAKITDKLDRLESYLIQAGGGVEPLMRPLGTASSHLDLPLKVEPGNRPLAVGDVAFALGGAAQTVLGLSSFSTPSLPAHWRGPVPDGDAIQVLSVAGKIGLRGSASGAFGHGAVSFSSAMAGSGRISSFHQYAAETTRAAALVESANAWALPWDLDALSHRLNPVDEQGHTFGLRRVQVQGRGRISLAGGVRVGQVVEVGAGPSGGLDANAFSVTGALGAGLDFSLARAGSFIYTMEKDVDDLVNVTLERSNQSRRSRSLSLGADIDVTGLDTVTKAYMGQFFDDPAELLSTLDKWTSPGDRLIERLTPDDWNLPAVEQVSALLLGHVSSQQLSAAAATGLDQRLRDVLNQKVPFWGETSADVADQLISAVVTRLDLGPELAAALSADIRAILIARLDRVRLDFEEHIESVVANAGDGLETLLTPLASIGESVSDLVERVNASTSAVVAPAISLLKRYQGVRLKLLTGFEKVARYKIGIAYAAQIQQQRGSSTLLRFRIRQVNATTKAIQRAFLLGRLDSAWDLFQAAIDRQDPWIDRVDGRFAAFVRRESSVGFSISFGDTALSMQRVSAADIDVQISPNGTVLVAAAAISQESVVKAFRVTRAVGFSGAYDLAIAARDPMAFPTPLGFNLAYEDQRMRPEELRQFLGSLEQPTSGRALLGRGATENAVTTFVELSEVAQGGGAKARVDVSLPVGLQDLARLIHVSNDRIREHAADRLIELIINTPQQRRMLQTLASSVDGGIKECDLVFLVAKRGQSSAIRWLERQTGEVLGRGATSPTQTLVRRLRAIGRDAEALSGAVDGVRGIARLQQQIGDLPPQPPHAATQDLLERLEALSDQINDGLDNWLETRRPWSGIVTEAVPVMTIALLALIADLTGDDTTLVPVIDVPGVEGGQIAVI